METIILYDYQIKKITEFIIKNSLVLHPTISPRGCPDFTGNFGKKYILIIDRNIMTKIIELCNTGKLNDKFMMKIISAIMFWAEINGISITGGIALSEYATYKNSNHEASIENNIFLNMFDQYPVKTWLDLFECRTSTIPIIDLPIIKAYDFNVENEHYKMHFAEILHIFSLYLDNELSNEEKMIALLTWIDHNILFCAYTVVYATLLFTLNIKKPNIDKSMTAEDMLKKCSNQAWDLTYLSFWSTLYWDEAGSDTIHIFATMDKDLKKIFVVTHDINISLFMHYFGADKGLLIQKHYNEIIKKRTKPDIDKRNLNELIFIEKNRLINMFY